MPENNPKAERLVPRQSRMIEAARNEGAILNREPDYFADGLDEFLRHLARESQQMAKPLPEPATVHHVRTGDVLIFDDAPAIAMRGPFALMDVAVQPSPPHINVVELAMKRLRRLDAAGRDVTEEFGLWDESDRWQLVTP